MRIAATGSVVRADEILTPFLELIGEACRPRLEIILRVRAPPITIFTWQKKSWLDISGPSQLTGPITSLSA
jgi:hypothetical protein